MKKLQCIILAILLFAAHTHAQMAVFDPTNWLTAIDTLYATYDQLMNTVQQLKTQYEQLQHETGISVMKLVMPELRSTGSWQAYGT